MVFSQAGRYALRIMAILAIQPEAALLRAKDLAESTRVPAAYLSKVLRRLTEAGLLLSKKGHHGGFRLARPASEIRLKDVLEAVNTLSKRAAGMV